MPVFKQFQFLIIIIISTQSPGLEYLFIKGGKICHVSSHPYIGSENIPFSAQAALILLMSAFFCKKFAVFVQKSIFTQSNNMRAVLEIFQFCFQFFVRQKVTVAENITLQILCPESGLQTAPNWPKIQKMTMASHFSDMTSTSIFDVLFLLSSLVTGPSFISISSLVLEL